MFGCLVESTVIGLDKDPLRGTALELFGVFAAKRWICFPFSATACAVIRLGRQEPIKREECAMKRNFLQAAFAVAALVVSLSFFGDQAQAHLLGRHHGGGGCDQGCGGCEASDESCGCDEVASTCESEQDAADNCGSTSSCESSCNSSCGNSCDKGCEKSIKICRQSRGGGSKIHRTRRQGHKSYCCNGVCSC